MSFPLVPLAEVLVERRERIGSVDADELPLLGVSNQEGLHRSGKERIADMSRYFRVERDWFAYNPMRINVGSIGWAETDEQTGVISPDYVVFSCGERVLPRLVYLFLRSRTGLDAINFETAGSVRERLYFEALGRVKFPLPPLAEQRRIVARVEAIAARVTEARRHQVDSDQEISLLLMNFYRRITEGAPVRPLSEVAPLTRRPVSVDPDAQYPQIAARSFGRGTFHQPTLSGSDVTWQKPFRVHAGDILISNIKAWEGAIAVVKPEDDGRYGSHRYLTCVPIAGVATARFVCFHLLTPEGLHHVGEASPGSADRNRTTGSKALMQIPVPVPPIADQLRFDALQAKADALRGLQAETAAELDALLPAVLAKAFAGEL